MKTLKSLFNYFIVISIINLLNCAAFNRKNTPLIRAVETNLIPEKYPAKAILAPIYIPLGVVGGILDVFVIHPALQIKPALLETKKTLWSIQFNGYFTEMGSLPIRLILSPAYFSLDFLMKSTFDLDSERDYSLENREKKESIETLLTQKNTNGIINWVYYTQITIKEKEVIQNILTQYPANSENGVYPSVIEKLCSDVLYKEYEDFLISLFPSNSNNNLTYCLTRKKSKKFSSILLNSVMSSKLSSENFQEYMEILLKIQDPEDLKTLRLKLQK